MKIIVLFHEKCRNIDKYFISAAADIWRRQGHDVSYQFGTSEFHPADVCILHVDLTIVPDKYLELANRYPVTINGCVRSISKSSFSKNLVDRNTGYQGSVIVKTDENYAGWPEKLVTENRFTLGLERVLRKIKKPRIRFTNSFDYRIFPSVDSVPECYLADPRFIVEKFVPERENDFFVCHSYIFFGEVHHGFREYSHEPIVKSGSSILTVSEFPHKDIIKARYAMGFDYGKFDYCIYKNEVHLLDVNKTFGKPAFVDRSKFEAVVAERASGLFTLVNQARSPA